MKIFGISGLHGKQNRARKRFFWFAAPPARLGALPAALRLPSGASRACPHGLFHAPKQKRPNLKVQPLGILCMDDVFVRLSQLVDVQSQLRLQVVSLVLVDNVCLSQLIQHLGDSGVHSNGFCLVCSSTELTNSISHGLTIISVVKSSCLFLSDSFQ